MLFSGQDITGQPPTLPPLVGDLDNTWFLGPTRVYPPIGVSIGLAVFAGLTNITNGQTDTQPTLLRL